MPSLDFLAELLPPLLVEIINRFTAPSVVMDTWSISTVCVWGFSALSYMVLRYLPGWWFLKTLLLLTATFFLGWVLLTAYAVVMRDPDFELAWLVFSIMSFPAFIVLLLSVTFGFATASRRASV